MVEEDYEDYEDPEGPMSRGGYRGSRFGLTRFSQSTKQRGRRMLDVFLMVLFVAFIGVAIIYGIAWFNSDSASRGIAGLTDPFDAAVNFFQYQIFQKPQEVGSVWTAKSNSSAETLGILFDDFESVGSKSIPYGALAAFRYDVDVSPGAENVPVELDCVLLGKDVGDILDGKIKTLPEKPMISYDNSMSSSNLRCQFKTKASVSEKKTVRVQGKLSFEGKTSRAKRKVYFISSEGYANLDKDRFFKEIKSELPLKTSYNKEAVEVGIGISASDDYKEPVVVGEEAGYIPLIGISLINKWGGIVKSIDDLAMYLPEGVSINTEYSPKSTLCPFSNDQVSPGTKFKRYMADKSLLDQIEPFGKGKLDLGVRLEEGIVEEAKLKATSANFVNFECWLDVDSSLATNSPVPDAYLVDVAYHYEYSPMTEAVTLNPTGAAGKEEESSEESSEEIIEEVEEEEETPAATIYYLCRSDIPSPHCNPCNTNGCGSSEVEVGQYNDQVSCDRARSSDTLC